MKKITNKHVSRRGVLKGISIAGLIPLCPEIMAMPMFRPPYKRAHLKYSDLKVAKSSCAMECLHCNLTAYSYKNRVVKVEASKGFNVKGCMRGLSRVKWVHHKERLTTPLIRTGEKGKGEFKPISWSDALDLIESKIRKTIEEHGNKGLMWLGFSGNMDSIKNAMGFLFFQYLGGATFKSGSICCGAAYPMIRDMVGFRFTDTRDTIKDSKYLLCWGNNPAITLHAYWKEFTKAKRNGARIVVIDPRYNETAAKADEWVPIIPGTDLALALGMIRYLFEHDLIDVPFLKKHSGAPWLVDNNNQLVFADEKDNTSNLIYDLNTARYVRQDTPDINPALWRDELPEDSPYTPVLEKVRNEAESWTLKRTSGETSVPEETIERLAREFGTSQAAMIVFNMSGAQRVENGAYSVAAQHYIPLLTGQIGRPGSGWLDAGGATQMTRFGLPLPFPKGPREKIPAIPNAEIGRAIVEERPHKIDFFYIQTHGAMTQLPNTNMVKKAFNKVQFVVVADNLMTDHARWADLVLPVTTIFEDVSLMAGNRSHYVQLMEKAVEPPGVAKPDYWIFARLAERFGFGEVFNQPIEHYMENVLKGTGITLEQLRKGPVKPAPYPWIPFKDYQFRTPSGKANFYLSKAKKKGFLPFATYIPVEESPKGNPELAKKYPLMCVQRKLPRSVHSSHANNELVLEIQRNEPHVMMHPDDASARGIGDGQKVTVFNDRGEHTAKAEVTSHIMVGVVSVENGWWERHGGSTSNITPDKPEPIGHGQCCNSNLVNVRLASEA